MCLKLLNPVSSAERKWIFQSENHVKRERANGVYTIRVSFMLYLIILRIEWINLEHPNSDDEKRITMEPGQQAAPEYSYKNRLSLAAIDACGWNI